MRRIRNLAVAAAVVALLSALAPAVAATQTAPSAPAKGVLAVTYYFLPG